MSSKEGGPGTELAKLIPDWAVKDGKGCSCKSMAAKMDKMGPDWCLENIHGLIAHVLSQEDHLVPTLKILPAAAKRVGAALLLKRAIYKAKGF